jgi:restriction system protein
MAKPLSLRKAAFQVLTERGPMHYRELAKVILDSGLATSSSQTPAASLNAVLAIDIKRKGATSPFLRVKPGVFAVRGPETGQPPNTDAEADSPEPAAEDGDQLRVRVPLFPSYAKLRKVLAVWAGLPRKQITGLQSTVNQLRGTPQKTVDWTDPDTWIPERLSGGDRELAQAIWSSSAGTVNPRHVYGHWLLAQRYDLLREDEQGCVQITPSGQDFLDHPLGDTEARVDEMEGVLKLLAIVADNGPARPAGLFDEWADYLHRRSSFGSTSTIKDTLRRRLANVLERELVTRSGARYSISEAGLAYLGEQGDEDAIGSEQNQEIWSLVRQQEASVRESLRELLLDMDPFGFEHLVKRLLEEMDYQDVEVTSPSNDGGVDVIANIELGITSVREVVQAKRHRRTIQRKDLDALRGSLYRFNAVRGTIITTSRFSKGTQEAAFAGGAAPITLIDGDKLIDLLIQHGIGVRKKTVEVLEVEPEDFAAIEAEA